MPRFSLIFTALLLAPFSAAAQSATFSDLPEDHYAHEAVMFLKEQGILSGYEDGTFRPEAPVNRAEALKIIIAPLITEEQLTQAKEANSVFGDIANDAWFKPYVEIARVAGVVDGPPNKANFNGGNPVIKAEFMKMTAEAFGAEPETAFSEIKLPLSQDVADVSQWYYPYMRYGLTASMTMISNEGTLSPGKQLSRAETAVLLYRFIMYQQNRRTQALLSAAENEIMITLSFLEQNNLAEAEYASARALLSSRGALAARPEEKIVQGAVKISESFRSLVRGYKAGVDKDYEETVRLAGEAYNLAEDGKSRDASLTEISGQVQNIAKGMADSARAKLSSQEVPSE